MALADLSDVDRRIVLECLQAAANGPFFPDWEFQTLFGLERSEVAEIANRWPNVDENDDNVYVAIKNAMNNLLGYPIDREREWSNFISVGPQELARVFAKLRGALPLDYFDGLE